MSEAVQIVFILSIAGLLFSIAALLAWKSVNYRRFEFLTMDDTARRRFHAEMEEKTRLAQEKWKR